MNKEKNNFISLLLDDSLGKESLDMLISLEPTNLYFHMKENPQDMDTLLLAKMLHENQVDKNNIDYIVHLVHAADISLKIKDSFSFKYDTSIIDDSILVKTLLLHDSLEDKEPEENARKFNKTVEGLLLEYNMCDKVIESIDDMTRKENERYKDFIERIKTKNNPYSVIGKTSDSLSNIHPKRKTPPSLEKRYKKTISNITEGKISPSIKKENHILNI